MKPFEYHDAKSVEEACSLLEQYVGDAKILSGGQSLTILLRRRLASFDHIINIKSIPGLDYITREDDGVRIGPTVSYRMLEESRLIKDLFPGLADAASVIADVQIRNAGTVGGNLSHGDPTTDLPPIFMSLGAKVHAIRKSGQRTIPLEDFYVDYFTTRLEANELLAEVFVPYPQSNSSSCYRKHVLRQGDMAIASVGAAVTVKNNIFESARITIGGVGPVPVRARAAEEAALGKKVDEIKKIGEIAGDEIDPHTDLNASSWYRRELVKTLTKRVLEETIHRIQVR